MDETIDDARMKRLHIRAQIRALNHMRPRCSGCGNDMLMFDPEDYVTEEQINHPDFGYLKIEDYQPGDLVCFWCIARIVEVMHVIYPSGTA